jgi:hypothetical protein
MKLFTIASVLFFALSSFAENELIVHVTEFGVGKFHRADNKAHAYDNQNVWKPYILPEGATSEKALVVKNEDKSYTVFFSTLDEMLASVVKISQSEGRKVSVLNVHGHGLPGAMWFPKDDKALSGFGCSQWKDAASGSDQDNINQYYSAVSASEIRQIRQMSNGVSYTTPCTTGLKEWQGGVAKNPTFKTVLADEAQVHFLSCVVGLGVVGDNFTKGIAALLLANGKGHVETSMNFGLGDWSMPDGMGFWDYITDAQLNHDNSIYPVNHKDAEIAQKGQIRMASQLNSIWRTSVLTDQSFLPMNFDSLTAGIWTEASDFVLTDDMPESVRLIGTNVRLPLLRR